MIVLNIHFREAELKDKDFILKANEEINALSNLKDSTFVRRIEEDVFKNKICKVIVAEDNNSIIGFVLYSYVYWANCGKGIYLSQAYIHQEYRKKGIFKMLLQELETREKDCHFITDLVGCENEGMMHSLEKLEFQPSDLIMYYKMINK